MSHHHTDLLKRLLPPMAYDPNGMLLSAELAAEGAALDAAQASASQLLRETFPYTVSAMLTEWEYEYGLSNIAPDGTETQSIATYLTANIGRTALKIIGKDSFIFIWDGTGNAIPQGKLI